MMVATWMAALMTIYLIMKLGVRRIFFLILTHDAAHSVVIFLWINLVHLL
jgi:hypothetical protein